jgi:Smg protein
MMFDVLVFVYENYWQGDTCPAPEQLERKLSAVGFDSDEIHDALHWLDGLNLAAQSTQWLPGIEASARHRQLTHMQSAHSLRVYSLAEQEHLGVDCLGFIHALECAGSLPSPLREIVIDRAMAAPGAPLPLDDLKLIVLLVSWRFGEEPDAALFDELFDADMERVAH